MSTVTEISPDHQQAIGTLPTFSVLAENGTVYTMTFPCPICDAHHVVASQPRYHAIIDIVANCPSQEVAADIAESLLDTHLIAVAHCNTIESCYVWMAAKNRTEEWRLSCRTVEGNFEKVSQLITELHPYVQPSIVAHRIDLLTDSYRDWVVASVS